jgi:Holliday junction DNA helicase RuvA
VIGKLIGTVDELRPTEALLMVNGVGYQCQIPLSTYERLKLQEEALLYTYTYHRDDQLKLFGFATPLEKNLFIVLIGISGIGPAMALSILSGIGIAELMDAVRGNKPGVLLRIPGVGKNKAEKLIFELVRRLKKIEQSLQDVPAPATVRTEAIEALLSLGFEEGRSTRAVDQVLNSDGSVELEILLKRTLRILSS